MAIPTLEALENSSYELVGLISTPDAPAGRGRTLTPNDFVNWSNQTGRSVFKPNDFAELAETIVEVSPDIVITIAYGKLIPESLLAEVRLGWLNLHFSLLPRWRGAAPVQWALINGDAETGVTVFKLEKGMDTGPIFTSAKLAISESSTTDSLLNELSVLGSVSVLKAIDLLLSGSSPEPQSAHGTFAPKITKSDAAIDWAQTSKEVDSLIRAMTSNPGAWTKINGTRIVVNKASRVNSQYNEGEIRQVGEAIHVGTSEGAIALEIVTPEGKRTMSASDWFRGARLANGSICEKI